VDLVNPGTGRSIREKPNQTFLRRIQESSRSASEWNNSRTLV